MSYTHEDAMQDQAYDEMSRHLYPEHRDQAIEEFTSERLRSYYLKNPDVAVNGARALKEALLLSEHGHPSACVIFAVTSIEQFLKAALLKPVVFGLIHVESLASLVMDLAMDQNGGLDRYKKLLAGLFKDLADIDVATIRRKGATKTLLDEVKDLQDLRNKAVHRGVTLEESHSTWALEVAASVISDVFVQLLDAIGLEIIEEEYIVRVQQVRPRTYIEELLETLRGKTA